MISIDPRYTGPTDCGHGGVSAGHFAELVNPLGALREDLTRFAPDALSPIERMRLLAAHDRLVRLAGRLAQPPRPVPARR